MSDSYFDLVSQEISWLNLLVVLLLRFKNAKVKMLTTDG